MHAPADLDAIRAEVSFRKWRLHETASQILAELAERIDWPRLYAGEVQPEELLGWGLFLEESVPAVLERLRQVAAEPEPEGARRDADPAELEDHLHWGTRQIESSIRQSLSVLSREMVGLITGGTDDADHPEERRRRALAMPIAELTGKLRSEIRKFTAFLVAGDTWDAGATELVLFPQRRQELESSRQLKERLVETMERFRGSEDRLAIAEVLRLWRRGRVHGQAALAEIDLLRAQLDELLAAESRQALYIDSYYRLQDWSARLRQASEGLKEGLGDERVERPLVKEVAAVLDTDVLADLIGEEAVATAELPRDLQELIRLVRKRELQALDDVPEAERRRLLELKASLESSLGVGEWGELASFVELQEDEEKLLRWLVGRIKGRKLVEHLRVPGQLPDELAELGFLQPLVIESEEGLKTYLMLLYGQIQNRDLHLLAEDQREIPLAEKRLALEELLYRRSRLVASPHYQPFESARRKLGAGEPVATEDWEALQAFLEHLSAVYLPRFERLVSFAETRGLADDAAEEMREALHQLEAMTEPPTADQATIAETLLNVIRVVLDELPEVRLEIAPPQTEAELEDFLNMLG